MDLRNRAIRRRTARSSRRVRAGQLGQRFTRSPVEILGLGPRDQDVGFEDEERVRRAVENLRDPPRARVERGIGASHLGLRPDDHQVTRPTLPTTRSPRTRELGRHFREQGAVVRTIPRLVQVEPLVERLVAQLRQECDSPAQQRLAVAIGQRRSREMPLHPVVFMERPANPVKMLVALLAPVLTNRRNYGRDDDQGRHRHRRGQPDHAGDATSPPRRPSGFRFVENVEDVLVERCERVHDRSPCQAVPDDEPTTSVIPISYNSPMTDRCQAAFARPTPRIPILSRWEVTTGFVVESRRKARSPIRIRLE